MILSLRATQQMERDEARHVAQMRVAGRPDRLEIGLRSFDDLEAIHGDEHGRAFVFDGREGKAKPRFGRAAGCAILFAGRDWRTPWL